MDRSLWEVCGRRSVPRCGSLAPALATLPLPCLKYASIIFMIIHFISYEETRQSHKRGSRRGSLQLICKTWWRKLFVVSGRDGYTPSTRKPYLPLMGSANHPSIVSRKFLQGPDASRPIPWKPAAIPGHGGTGGRCSAAMQQGHVDGAADRNRHRRLVIASRAVLLLLLPCNCACVVHNAMGKSPHGTMCKLPNTGNGFVLCILDMRILG